MSICKTCNSEIKWVKTDRWYCQNTDGSDHWDLCAQLKLFNFKAHGKAFTAGKDSGLRVEKKYGIPNKSGSKIKTELYLERIGKTVTGKNYKPDGCDCGLPPWELCQPDCVHVSQAAA